MTIKGIGKIVTVLVTLALAVWIIFNPYCSLAVTDFIIDITQKINGFCTATNLSYRFSETDILNFCRVLEYSIFGIMLALICKVYFKSFWKNITSPLFFGLLLPIVEVYFRYSGVGKIKVEDVLFSFLEVCIGITVFVIFSNVKIKKKSFSKYKKSKYSGRY